MAVCSRGGGCRAVLGQGKWRSPGSCSADPVLFFRPHVFPFPEHSDPAVGKEKDHRGHRGLCSQESPTNPAKISLSPGWNSCLSVNAENAKLHTQNFISIDFYLVLYFLFIFYFGLQCTPLSSNNIQGYSNRQARIQITVKEITPCKIERVIAIYPMTIIHRKSPLTGGITDNIHRR